MVPPEYIPVIVTGIIAISIAIGGWLLNANTIKTAGEQRIDEIKIQHELDQDAKIMNLKRDSLIDSVSYISALIGVYYKVMKSCKDPHVPFHEFRRNLIYQDYWTNLNRCRDPNKSARLDTLFQYYWKSTDTEVFDKWESIEKPYVTMEENAYSIIEDLQRPNVDSQVILQRVEKSLVEIENVNNLFDELLQFAFKKLNK